uniref:hypothetical protein n=1 Tax=Clostridium sp. NkU-1 TaxID=1095009 RepID=UPI0032601C90
MLYGWIDENGERKTDDNAWRDGLYYCGDENDGAQSNGWAFLHIKDDQWDNDDKIGYSDANTFDDEEQDRWFYFKDNGKKLVKKKR